MLNAWTTEDDAKAVELLTRGWQLWRIADALDRTEAAVSARLKRLGVAVPKGRTFVNPVVAQPRPGRPSHFREPTAEELEALIAEQMKCLPPWWESEVEAEACRRGELPPATVLRGKSLSVAGV